MGEGGDPNQNRLLGYAVATLAVALATIAVVAMIASVGGGSDGDADEPQTTADVTVRDAGPDVLPEGGLFKIPEDVDGAEAGAAAAGCELKDFRAKSRDHVGPNDPPVDYSSDPPTSGRHDPTPAPDGAKPSTRCVRSMVEPDALCRALLWMQSARPG